MGKIQEKGRLIALNFFKGLGFELDSYGNLKKIDDKGNMYRIKFNPNKLRYEKRIYIGGYRKYEWIRIYSGYYKDIEITEDNKLKGLKRSY